MIVMENVCKSYPKSGGRGATRVLDGVSFHIHPREYAAFIGPSGSGKSTLLNLIGCLDLPTSGRYALDGVEVPPSASGRFPPCAGTKSALFFRAFSFCKS
ncbi:MAG: ATP-binding cassette domain-containing protein [Lachnospiraceae bacterium]